MSSFTKDIITQHHYDSGDIVTVVPGLAPPPLPKDIRLLEILELKKQGAKKDYTISQLQSLLGSLTKKIDDLLASSPAPTPITALMIEQVKIPKKRGRKPKPKSNDTASVKIPKKRGRKPKPKYKLIQIH